MVKTGKSHISACLSGICRQTDYTSCRNSVLHEKSKQPQKKTTNPEMPTLTICCNCCIYLQDRLLYLSTIAAPDFLPNTSNNLLEHSDYPFSLLTTEAINESCVICLEKSNYHIPCFVSLSINNRGQMLSKVMFSHT